MAFVKNNYTGLLEIKELILLGIIQEVALIILILTTDLKREYLSLIILFWIPFGVYFFSIWRVSLPKCENREPSQVKKTAAWKFEAGLILFFAFIFHITPLYTETPLSNDIYRYYWDGKTLAHGVNPYKYNPLKQELAFLRDEHWEYIEDKHVNTIYPPIAQIFFSVSSLYPNGLLTFKLISVVFSLLSTWLIICILNHLRMDIRLSLIYGWSPLAAIEFGNSAHIDSLAIFWTLLSIFVWLKGKNNYSALFMAIAVASKIFPLLFSILFIKSWGKKGTMVFVGTLLGLYFPFLTSDLITFQGFHYFYKNGYFNGSIFPIILAGLSKVVNISMALASTKLLVFFSFLLCLGYWTGKQFLETPSPLETLRICGWLTGFFLIISPTVHPWYLTWILPFLCFFPSLAWIFFSGSVFLSKNVYVGYEETGLWHENIGIRILEYLPFYCLIIIDNFVKEKRIFSGRLGWPYIKDEKVYL